MTILLFPGRHLIQTTFQESYLRTIVRSPLKCLHFLPGTQLRATSPIDTIVFAVTSSNHQFTRYNPIPFHVRAIGVDRFARDLGTDFEFKYRIFGIPHYLPTQRFASVLLKEIAEQTEGEMIMTPENTVILSSTRPVAIHFQKLGFSILPAEAGQTPAVATPQILLSSIMESDSDWLGYPGLSEQISPTTVRLWHDFPEVPRRIARLWHDPLLTDDGSLTTTRNYSTYAQAMSNDAIINLKYQDIRPYIQPGRIVDEGCADGAMLVRIAEDFPDSDLVGIEITGELLARCLERQRAGEYGGAFVHFHQRNITSPIFRPETIHTTLCNSTIHELWSYNHGAETVTAYLEEKFRQIAPGGRLVVRDVVGPENGDMVVYLWLEDQDGEAFDAASHTLEVAHLSTFARFHRFAQDFLPQSRKNGSPRIVPYHTEVVHQQKYIVTTLRFAVEFMTKKDYTENWASEMHEEFAYWSISDWRDNLVKAGFIMDQASHVYTNQWIIDHRWQGKVALFNRIATELVPLPFPPTTIVVVAEKPLTLQQEHLP